MNRQMPLALATLACSFASAGACFGDTVLTARVELNGGNTRGGLAPAVGEYRFTFGKHQATISSPNGKFFVLDFDAKTFTGINPQTRTYFQTDISSVIAVGDRLPAMQSDLRIKGSVKFEPGSSSAPAPELAGPATAYQVRLDSTISEIGGSGAPFGGGISTRGGITFGAGNSSSRSSFYGRRLLEGRLWMGAPPAGVERDEANTALECLLLWGAPQLKELAKRIHESGLAILGGDFVVRTEGQRNPVGIYPPNVVVKVTSVTNGALDPSTLAVPPAYRKTSPPAGPLGG